METVIQKISIIGVIIIGIIIIAIIIGKAKEAVHAEENQRKKAMLDELHWIGQCNDAQKIYGVLKKTDNPGIEMKCELRLIDLAEDGDCVAKYVLALKYLRDYEESDHKDKECANDIYAYLQDASKSSNHELANDAQSLFNQLNKAWKFNPDWVKPKSFK